MVLSGNHSFSFHFFGEVEEKREANERETNKARRAQKKGKKILGCFCTKIRVFFIQRVPATVGRGFDAFGRGFAIFFSCEFSNKDETNFFVHWKINFI